MDNRNLLERVEQCMGWLSYPIDREIRGTNVVRPADRPPPNISIPWHTNYDSAREFLQVLEDVRSALSASTNEKQT